MEHPDTVFVEGRQISPAKLADNLNAFTSQKLLFSKPKWMPDEEATWCHQCQSKFSALRRKHHCRNCGQVFCAQCCRDKITLPHLGLSEPERICSPCKPLAGIIIMALSSSLNVQLEATQNLYDLCKDPQGMGKCLEIGGLQALVFLAKSKDLKVREMALQSLQCLCPQTSLHQYMDQSGVTQVVCKILQNTDTSQEALLMCCIEILTLLCKSYDMRPKVLAASGLDSLSVLSMSPNMAVSLLALQCLSLLLDHSEAFNIVCDQSKKTTLSKIINLCKNSDEQVQEVSLRILANISSGSDWHKQRIVQEDVFAGGVLASVLASRPHNRQVLVNVTCLVANLAATDNTQGSLIDKLPALCNLVSDYYDQSDVLVHIARVVSNFAKHKQNCDIMMPHLPLVICTFLKSSDTTQREYGFQAVILLLGHSSSQTISHLQRQGVTEFLQCLSASSAIMNAARQTLEGGNPTVVKPRVL